MDEQRFKIWNDLIIAAQVDKGKTFYSVINPFSGSRARFDAKAYLILRHFNGRRDLTELARHLQGRHKLYLSSEALESYVDLFLDAYLFDCGALEIYWERLDQARKGML